MLHRDFSEQARRTPGAIALHEGDVSIRYADLDAASNRIATSLQALAIRDGAVVGLHMERSIRFVTAMLGILKANCAVVPLPPSYPPARIGEILAFAKLDAVVEDEAAVPMRTVSRIVGYAELLAGTEAATGAASGNPEQAAFVLCSSGSTGQPKMIVRSHRSFYQARPAARSRT
jgi:pristinamycin I synthase 3 and 4